MKKILVCLAIAGFAFTSCENEQEIANVDEQQVDMGDFYLYTDADDSTGRAQGGRDCHSMKVLNKKLNENPGLYASMYDVEKNVRSIIGARTNAKGKPGGGGNGGNDGGGGTPVEDNLGVINIPVVVHVLYNTSSENISDAQIASQMAVLNGDFNLQNNDASSIPSLFAPLAADTDINFNLVQTIRKASSRTSWGTNDAMKSSASGGSDVVSPDTHLNIWVCNIGGGILGYAQFPGGAAATDGVVVAPQYFGTTGTAQAPFNGGRTATHEVGHYLNLRHIWGDGRCKQDDFVADTPSSDGPNYGCPSFPTTNCRSTDMTMNYMDYTNDACMNMFSQGQKERMRALFAPGSVRDGFTN
ncbi:zinc metalloprotease [Dokdonia sp. Hel_I_53]|uniref:zinc metalloprotease n=1 Tax=Dokdonia sp. Hel_I_53 TaxID=1566287 RepID=UPI00119A631F|nr:zinc metalloprotease [Dokdonia sp. Hel_I_53]TVZ50908.1 pregnancy-associated plasma protein-A [Dokdonia sp. Hel_I_53]